MEGVMKESEKLGVWQMLLWLEKNKIFVKDDVAKKNMFIIHEYQTKLKLKEKP
jgi:hypothetical protein